MPKEMIINCTEQETRIAVLDNNELFNLYIERKDERSLVGDIYTGKVVRVLPGMQAAFVDIGLDRAAFLYVTDVWHDQMDFENLMNEEHELVDCERKWDQKEHDYSIEDILKEGQEILVQVLKEPLGNKGARITTHISLPGRNLVLMPTLHHIGISRKIKDENERKRLQEIMEQLRPDGYGFIARTVSEGKGKEELRGDIEYLIRLWEAMKKKRSHVSVPALVHKELGLTLRSIRDLYTEEVKRIVVDSREKYKMIVEFIETFMPSVGYNIELYENKDPIFDYFSIEYDIGRLLNKKVWLKSGGYIIIDETEALCAIDVNTGKYVGKRNLEETIFKTNLEALKEIAYQLRVRNLGGIIIIDFIDMEIEINREKIFNTLKEELEKDRNKTNIQKISELGLIEMTRERTGKSLGRILCESCPYCDGRGVVKSKTTICYEILRALEREMIDIDKLGKTICVLVHPDIGNILFEDERNTIEKLEKQLGNKIYIKVDNNSHHEHFEIIPMQ